jgi:4,5-DOPA dioxygenase extradiol
MLTSHALLAPHLPTLVVDQYRRHHTPMLEALARASERLLAEEPAAVVVLSARWPSHGPFLVDAGRRHETLTDYAGFGVELRYDCNGHPALANALVEGGRKAGVHVGSARYGVDSGVSVPMHFLAPAAALPIVPISLAPRGLGECRAWGSAVRGVLAAWKERVAFVVGGLLSYNEHAWSLSRELPETRLFDEAALASLRRGEWSALGAQEPGVVEKAEPEAGLRHLAVLRGFLGDDVPGEVRCYQSLPGVGAALVEFPIVERVESGRPEPPEPAAG